MLGRRLRDDAGFSLVEIMVTTTLLLMVLGILTPGVVATMRTMSVADQRTTDLGQAQLGLAAASRNLRAAAVPAGMTTAFLEASPDAVELYSNIDDATTVAGVRRDTPARVRIEVVDTAEGRVLRETVQPGRFVDVAGTPTWQADPARPARQRVLARGVAVVDLVANPYFRYHTANDGASEFTPDPTNPSSLITIRSITVELSVAGAPQRNAGQSQLRQQIRLPNL